MEGQGQAAKYQAGDQGQPLALFELALLDKQNAVNHHRAEDQHRCRAEDAPDRQAMPGEIDDAGFDFVDNEKQ